MLGGPIITGATLTRFFALHVFVIPGTLLAFTALHVWMVLKLGINEWPMPGRIVRRDTYIQEYNELTHKDGIPFVPGAVWKDLVFSAAILFAVAFCAAMFGPYRADGRARSDHHPDRAQAGLLLSVDLHGALVSAAGDGDAVHSDCAGDWRWRILLALPFVAGRGREELVAAAGRGVLGDVSRGVLCDVFTHLGTYTPWSPQMNALERRSGSGALSSQERTPLERQGAIVFQEKQCRNCHPLGGVGGQRGPALDDVATRLTEDQLIRQVLQGGGNMPAYGKTLSPAETTALVAFLETLHPANQPAAIDASRHVAETNNPAPKEPVEAIRP